MGPAGSTVTRGGGLVFVALCVVESRPMAMDERPRLRMDKPHRLRKSAEFRLVRGEGRSWAHRLAALYARPNGMALSRIGISVSKRIGNAVTRNRAKRLIREASRVALPGIVPGWDLLFIARAPIADADLGAVRAAVERLLSRSGLAGIVDVSGPRETRLERPADQGDVV